MAARKDPALAGRTGQTWTAVTRDLLIANHVAALTAFCAPRRAQPLHQSLAPGVEAVGHVQGGVLTPGRGAVQVGAEAKKILGHPALIAYAGADCWHWLVVPCPSALRKAREVTAVGFFGDLRPEMDHAAIYQLEAEVVERLSRYAADGLLSYYDAELEPGIHGNLVLFATREVPAAWHGDVVHARAVLLAPRHYRCLRLHRGIIRGPLLGSRSTPDDWEP